MNAQDITPVLIRVSEPPYGAITAYEVRVGGDLIGVVSQFERTTHRKAGRLIAATFHPKRWAATRPDETVWMRDAFHYTRRDAVDALLRAKTGQGASDDG